MANWENALKLDSVNFAALSGLIGLYSQRQEFDKAHARIDQALNSYPNNASLHYLKAQVYMLQHNAQATEAELRKTIELDGSYIAAYHALGALFINMKQEDRAISEYQQIVKMRPDNPVAYTMIGMLEDSRKNYDAAADNYRKALAQDSHSVIAANNLAWLYAAYGKGNLDEAVKLAQGVVQRNPNVAGFVDTLGWVYYKKNLYAAAAEQLRRPFRDEQAPLAQTNQAPSATYHCQPGHGFES